MLLTKREKQLLDSLKNKYSVKDGAVALGISPNTAYNMIYRIRKKYREARNFINTILTYRRTSSLLDVVLSIKQPLWKEIKEMEKQETL